ncbi:DUF2334 domain-containing protein [Terrisporobacter glycolicus]|uniref:DUF2334 domain-containing protein n=1 Tax=Terrisporobacter glycolicus ATCC 14880 = DSM 1288 TaxID=1121315 RepID=A0ABZ2ER60_9FIRM|nr:DUF2334 domain-containing protein [Terrisporobacter glycolicus]
MTCKNKCLILFLALFFFLSSSLSSYAIENKTLIVYEMEKNINSNENKVNYLNELLYAFNKKVEKININQYKSGYMNDFDYVFVLNIENDIKSDYFFKDLNNYKNKIYWIENKIEDFLSYSNKYSISYDKQNTNITKLFYNKDSILIEPGYLFNIIKPSKKSITLSTMSDNYNTYPLIINEDNLYYISRWDLNNSFIFEDSLNDFFNIKYYSEEKIFVKIEDVSPLKDIKKLKESADYLYSKNVPFIISLASTYIDAKTKSTITLNMKPEFIETIKYMKNKGGTVVLHGYKHKKDSFISELRHCLKNDIYPLAFEADDQDFNIADYKEMKKYFSTYIGQYNSNKEILATYTSPYIIKNSDAFNILIPENLGYINDEDIFSVDKIKENYKKLSMVRGYNGGFSFNPDLDVDYLKEIIEFLREEDVKFLNLKEENNYIKIDDISIISENNIISSSYDKSKPLSTNKEKSKFEILVKDIDKVVINFITVILVLFIIIFIIFRKININKFKRR